MLKFLNTAQCCTRLYCLLPNSQDGSKDKYQNILPTFQFMQSSVEAEGAKARPVSNFVAIPCC